MGERENEEKYISMLKSLVLDAFDDEPCSIFLFGSRARGSFRRSSDYDIGFKGISSSKALKKISTLDTIIEESVIPHRVDWVFFDEADRSFQDIAGKDIVIWKA